MQESDTATRIVLAAEELFADQGFIETTMRQITTRADVNLAAVNYHYGSKGGLIEAVAKRFLDPLCAQLDQRLAEREGDDSVSPSVDELLDTLMRALLVVKDVNPHALSLFMRLLDLAYAPGQEELREFLIQGYGERVRPLIELVRKNAAPLESDEFFWRLHFLLGAMIFTLSNYATLSAFSNEGREAAADIERTLHRMIPVISAGFQARGESTWFCRV
ncbi:putative transcriptional regulator for fatty acid degradation FadQ, TetR family [Marinobacterium lacunae]|uniref:Putative transcriptional regulator for fatty acid degradation FadQ, TetR family n=1 Tax=Marinobacterium lacunae TaxID=1232683 RepID=A0A081FU14_9GAMM|nr:TetR/AcrR family transcriptional regulator [Marinobacterium lacunae]KEA62019.1 putative transcriptional regulator for fatty acid degradation FadQ, TetR family [Marinobacterium lacunae]MBR9882994.1 TetR/AcrR family transcriptional regulator [Oceanospirillales bacterium]